MKNLIKIVLGGTLVFMAISMIQEWEAFVGGAAERQPPDGSSEAAKAEAAQAVRSFISFSRHLYAGGDRRFAERLPATEEITAEILADVAYLRQMLESGVRGYLLKESNSEALLNACRSTLAGNTYIDGDFVNLNCLDRAGYHDDPAIAGTEADTLEGTLDPPEAPVQPALEGADEMRDPSGV